MHLPISNLSPLLLGTGLTLLVGLAEPSPVALARGGYSSESGFVKSTSHPRQIVQGQYGFKTLQTRHEDTNFPHESAFLTTIPGPYSDQLQQQHQQEEGSGGGGALQIQQQPQQIEAPSVDNTENGEEGVGSSGRRRREGKAILTALDSGLAPGEKVNIIIVKRDADAAPEAEPRMPPARRRPGRAYQTWDGVTKYVLPYVDLKKIGRG